MSIYSSSNDYSDMDSEIDESNRLKDKVNDESAENFSFIIISNKNIRSEETFAEKNSKKQKTSNFLIHDGDISLDKSVTDL